MVEVEHRPSPVVARRIVVPGFTQYPINEIFGPTRQGEGPQAGTYCFFVRLSYCDWRCKWCDTPYAIAPDEEGWTVTLMTVAEIISRLKELGAEYGDWITISGGNPALFVDEEFTRALHAEGFLLAMETQGSRVLKKNALIDCLIVSPKPPSSGMDNRFVPEVVVELVRGRKNLITAIKFVAFDEVDLEWIVAAKATIEHVAKKRGDLTKDNEPAKREDMNLSYLQWYMSAGTPLEIELPDRPEGLADIDKARLAVCDGITALWLTTLKDKRFKRIVMLGQLHVVVWGQKKGV